MMPRLKLRELSLRDLLLVVLPALLLIGAGFWFAYQFVKPAPPDSFVMSTGSPSGSYHAYAKRYQAVLARSGVKLELRTSSGSVENLARLGDPASGVQAAFVQSGTGGPQEAPDVRSLGAVYLEPVWIFHRGKKEIDHLRELDGLRIAIGPEGSGTRQLVLQLLAANGISAAKTEYLPLSGEEAAAALKAGRVDAAFFVMAPDSLVVFELLREERIRLVNFSRASAYTQRFPFLRSVVLPQGSIDLVRDLPPRDTLLVGPNANIVVSDDLHPALVDLLMQAMREVHGGAGIFHKTGEYPNAHYQDFPLSQEAERFYRSGPPFLQRYLPFWAATLLDRVWVMVVPLIALAIPLSRIIPPLYNWRVRSRIYRWYGELKYLENDVESRYDPAKHADYLRELDEIEKAARRRAVPLAFADQLYTLRQHIDYMRHLIDKRRGQQ